MKMKKVWTVVLAVAMVAALCVCLIACNDKESTEFVEAEFPEFSYGAYYYGTIPADFKVGLICLHDENSTYDKNFIDAMKNAQYQLGLTDEQVIIVTGIDESNACYQKACELVDKGCNIIFADSFGHEPFMIQAAEEHPEVQFCHATGVQAAAKNLDNYANAFASIYEGRYLAGVAAGMKLNEMIEEGKFSASEAKMGYVGAYTYAEVISGYTSFYLGAKSVCPTVTMDVTFTGSWYNEAEENNAAKSLIQGGCKLISQHADSMGAPNACEEAGVPNVSYNGSTGAACPNTFIVSSKIDWTTYYIEAITDVAEGYHVEKNYVGGIDTGSVVLTGLNANVMAKGTVEKLREVRRQLVRGEIEVFDVEKDDYITVNGEKLTTFKVGEKEAIWNGVFHESNEDIQSAPYFDINIDGITLLNKKFGDD